MPISFAGRASGICEGVMSEESIKNDLELHPNLSPILDTDHDGNVVCLGWVSPIFTWEDLPYLEETVLGKNPE